MAWWLVVESRSPEAFPADLLDLHTTLAANREAGMMATELPTPIERASEGPVKLYSIRSLDIATFLGSLLAGAFLLSRNLNALGRADEARTVLVAGYLGAIVVGFLVFSIVVPESQEPGLRALITGGQVLVVHVTARRVLGEKLAEHVAQGGGFYSAWRAAGIALLLLPVAVVALLAVAVLFPDLPALGE